MGKLFKNLDLEKINESKIEKQFIKDLSNSLLRLTFRYTEKKKAVFYKLHLKVGDANKIDLLKGTAVKDMDGSQTFNLGVYPKGTKVQIDFGVFAYTKIPKAIAILSQTNPQIAFQAAPVGVGKTKSIDSGTKWTGTIKYKVQ